jgi:hypothetical protein
MQTVGICGVRRGEQLHLRQKQYEEDVANCVTTGFIIYTLGQILEGEQIKENEIDAARRTR